MREYSSALITDILRREYPEVDMSIRKRLDDELPASLEDMTLIPTIIRSFKSIKGIQGDPWVNKRGSRALSENRELLVSVIILLYQPEKILRISNIRLKKFIITRTAAELNCSRDVLKKCISEIIVSFRAYKEFKSESYRLYELIKTENKFFQ